MPGAESLAVRTPEGVVLPFTQAGLFDRLAALLLDQFLLFVATMVILVGGLFLAGPAAGHFFALFLFAHFVLRMAYFPWFEMRGGGATPGKRMLRIRVISRDGGALRSEQVLARNLTREFEVMLPLSVAMGPSAVFPDLPSWAGLLCSLWMLVGAMLPLFNARRLRLGDLLGGTTVVAMPRTSLLHDLALETPGTATPDAGEEVWRFSALQLEQYGIDQLHVLEDLLRDETGIERELTLLAVMRKVEEKIGWPTRTPEAEARPFLLAFYRQLRANLEQRALFGERREHKRAGRLGSSLGGPGRGA
jgi:uncharacterized RDD family membrane protein YckC